MIKIELTYSTAEEAAEAMLRLAGGDDAPEAVAPAGDAPAAAATPARRGRPPKNAAPASDPLPPVIVVPTSAAEAAFGGTPAPATPVAAPVPAAASSPAPAATPAPAAGGKVALVDGPPMTDEAAKAKFAGEVRPALAQVMTKIGQDAARQFLADCGYEKLSGLEPTKYDSFIAACKAKAA